MDWQEDMHTDLWIFPRGMQRDGGMGVRKLDLHGKSIIAGDQTAGFQSAEPFVFLAPK